MLGNVSIPYLSLPVLRNRSHVTSYQELSFSLSPQDATLRQLNQKLNSCEMFDPTCSSFTRWNAVTLASWQIVLAHWSSEQDFHIGIEDASKCRREAQSLREVPPAPLLRLLQVHLQPDLLFATLVQHSFRALDPIGPRDTTAEIPTSMPGFFISEFGAIGQPRTVRSHPFELCLELVHSGSCPSFIIRYNAKLFDSEVMSHLGSQCWRILEAGVRAPYSQAMHVLCPTESERQLILHRWNDTKKELPSASLHDLVQNWAVLTPDSVALIDATRTVTYQSLDAHAKTLALQLLELGLKPEGVVGVYLSDPMERVIAFYAILKAGGAYLPLDLSYPPERIRYMLEDSQATCVVIRLSEGLKPGKTNIPTIIMPPLSQERPQKRGSDSIIAGSDGQSEWETVRITPPRADENIGISTHYGKTLSLQASDEDFTSTDPEALANVIYTSGTTGEPKGVEVTHRGVLRTIVCQRMVRLHANIRMAQIANTSFDAATFEIWGALVHGAKLFFVDRETLLEPNRFAAWLEVQQITTMFVTAALFNRIVAEVPDAFKDVHDLIVGGDALDPPSVQKALTAGAPTRIINGYGPTESTIFATFHVVTSVPAGAPSIPIGWPLSNATNYVLNDRFQLVPVGVVGELCIGGCGVARGYRFRPACTAEKFIADPFDLTPGARLYRSGDRARYLPDGTIEYLGRNDSQVKIRGFRVELGEIESILRSHPEVNDVAVLARPDGIGDRRLMGWIVLKMPGTVSESELRRWLTTKVPTFMVPSNLIFVSRIPLTENGKLNKTELPMPGAASNVHRTPPQTELEQWIAEQWRGLLSISDVAREDTLTALGGHSLVATKFTAQVVAAWGIDLKPAQVLNDATVASLAGQLLQMPLTEPADIDIGRPRRRPERLPLNFPQEPILFLEALIPDNRAYHFQMSIRLRGPLDVRALEASFSELVHRHESLRTTFLDAHDRPVQMVQAPFQVTIPITDLRCLPRDQREGEAEIRLREALRCSFDPRQLPLFWLRLYQLTDEDYLLIQVEHHLIHDGWSVAVLLSELEHIYVRFAAGLPSSLPPPSLQFADYVLWNREFMSGKKLEQELAWWQSCLQNRPSPTEIPSDFNRPEQPSAAGQMIEITIEEPEADIIRSFCREHNATLFTTLFSAFQVLLRAHTGQRDLLVGSGMANRDRPQTWGVVGMLVNTVPLRTTLSDGSTFLQVLETCRRTIQAAQTHQELPFDRLVAALNPVRDAAGTAPLLRILFSAHNAAVPPIRWNNVTGEWRIRHNDTAKFDLNITVIPYSDQQSSMGVGHRSGPITLLWEYATTLYRRETIETLIQDFRKLLQTLLVHSTQSLSDMVFFQEIVTRSHQRRPIPASRLALLNPIGSPRGPESAALENWISRLSPIWSEILRRRDIQPHDNFFELGGDSLLALELVHRVEIRYGQRPALHALLECPTLNGLAASLVQTGRSKSFATIVELKPNGKRPPLFILHSYAGTLFYYRPLAESFSIDQPVLGIQARGLDGIHEPFHDLEMMANWYADAILDRQPSGPIHLCGHSTGAYIAFEVAQSIIRRGQDVGILAILDAPVPSSDYLKPRLNRSFVSNAVRHAPNMLEQFWHLNVKERNSLLQGKLNAVAQAVGIAPPELINRDPWNRQPDIDVPVEAYADHMNYRFKLRMALNAWRPRPYAGSMLLLQARYRPLYCSHDPHLGWRDLVRGEITTIPITGTHSAIVENPLARLTAFELERLLQRYRS